MLINEHDARLDPRVKRTRKLLQKAFSDLLAEKGFQSITVADITERAEVNRATFYLHFEDKYDLLNYCVREALQQTLEQKLPDPQAFTLSNLRVLMVTACEFMGQFYGHCHPGTQSAQNDEFLLTTTTLQQYIYQILVEWMATEGDKASHSSSSEFAARTLSWIILGTGSEMVNSAPKQPPEQLADQMLSFLSPSLQSYFVDFAKR